MRFSLFIFIFCSSLLMAGQQTIKVRKKSQLHGFYQLQTDNKQKEFLYFDTNGNVALVTSSKRKRARGNLIACIENDNCATAQKGDYAIDELEISFAFNRGKGENIHFIEYDGQLSPDALFLTLKKGETGKLIEVKEFRRLKD